MITNTYPSTTNFFRVNLFPKEKESLIVMNLWTQQMTTKKLASVVDILKENLPSIFSSICYNDKKLPFKIEMKNTEIGHLYEHILLEYIAQLHFRTHGYQSEFVGVTSWNWKEKPRGTFDIVVNVGKKDKEIIKSAMMLTRNLVDKILEPLFYEVEVGLPARQAKQIVVVAGGPAQQLPLAVIPNR